MAAFKVVARLKAKPGKEKELEQLFHEMCKTVRANEPETDLYVVHRSKDDPSLFVWWESFRSKEAFDQHRYSQHMKYAVDKIQTLSEPPQFDFLTELDSK
jgi:quinol monooxygenase YgiN